MNRPANVAAQVNVAKLAIPTGHGERLTAPDFEEWEALAREAAGKAQDWTFHVAGVAGRTLRARARAEAITTGVAFSRRIGIPGGEEHDLGDRLLIVTGHQPELFHPGVWIKNFLVDRLAAETGGLGLNLVVDSDAFLSIDARTPIRAPTLALRRPVLAVGGEGVSFAAAPVVSLEAIDAFADAGHEALLTLRCPAIICHFREFCAQLRVAGAETLNLAEQLTFARRRYENRGARTTYLEAPVTELSRQSSFYTFAVDLAQNAERLHAAYNGALRAHRERNRTKNQAQPFPDLAKNELGFELPLWHLGPGGRTEVFVRDTGDGDQELIAEGGARVLARLHKDPAAARDALIAAAPRLAPKALALTLFHRMFVADLFVHGVGGARYDKITDVLCQRYYGAPAAPFVVTSMTMYLPLGAKVVFQREVDAAQRRLDRMKNNPDDLLDDPDVDLEPDDAARADALAAEKAALVRQIEEPLADKRALGLRIRAINLALGEILRSTAISWKEGLERMRAERAASDLITDRSYPFCFWDPREIEDKAR